MPKLAFVLPTHNRLEFVGECIESLRDQTEKEIEIIVVNDNSTDGSKEFLDEMALIDQRIKVIHNPENIGAGRSRNIGTEAASSPIIAVCDDDDTYPEDRAEVTIRWFQENPESELVNFPYMRIDYFGQNLEPFWGSPFDEGSFKESGVVNYFSNPTAAFRRESAMAMGGYPSETTGMTDDIQFVKKWIEAGKKIDFDRRAMTCLHRVLPNSMMAKMRGFQPAWVGQ